MWCANILNGKINLCRKAASTWTKQVQVNSDASPESPQADGYSWRKYGQKDILKAKNPR